MISELKPTLRDAVVHLIGGQTLKNVIFAEDKTFSPVSFTDSTVHVFVTKNRTTYFVQGDRILYVEVL